MDLVYIIHLCILFIIISIPIWPISYLKWGVYIPIIIAAGWLLFDGCPITKTQTNLKGDTFMQHLYKFINPSITSRQTHHINCFVLLLITIIGFHRIAHINIRVFNVYS
jgi:hypothetical protein